MQSWGNDFFIRLKAWHKKNVLKMKYYRQLLLAFAAIGMSVIVINK